MKMSVKLAWEIVGNQPRFAIVNMRRALTICSSLNTRVENEMLQAAKICLRNPNPRYT